ncbi:uncharacterized protein LOC104906146 [Beta vulgaris subsp. vulgaris]|uniref:uncharacterized protein LOC104906146 n=1 Tax=Beta vulgaris subsp. vulgaris TaxID=3555 RepID=UPI0025496520|nr:uncharacterized protein LOC104906146 [Beta vulgaris subsp. vulgaris]
MSNIPPGFQAKRYVTPIVPAAQPAPNSEYEKINSLGNVTSTLGIMTYSIQALENKIHIVDSYNYFIAKLETQIGQLANTMSKRDDGKLPSNSVENPKNHNNEQVKDVMTLRNGRDVDNLIEEKKRVPYPQALDAPSPYGESKKKEDILETFKQFNHTPKFKDPGVPNISCHIGDHKIKKALLDLGSSVNLIPYSVYEQLGLGKLQPSNYTLQLADRSVRVPRGRIYDVLVKIDKGLFPVDFVVLDMESVEEALPALISIDALETIIAHENIGTYNLGNVFELLRSILDHTSILETSSWVSRNEPLPPLSDSPSLLSIVSPPKLELKPLPSTLKYAYLGSNETLPVIISSEFSNE